MSFAFLRRGIYAHHKPWEEFVYVQMTTISMKFVLIVSPVISIYLQEKNNTKNDKLSIEHYIASKILRTSDAENTRRHSTMISLIQHLLKIDSKLVEQMKTNLNFISTSIFPCNILENVESIPENEKVSTRFFFFFYGYQP